MGRKKVGFICTAILILIIVVWVIIQAVPQSKCDIQLPPEKNVNTSTVLTVSVLSPTMMAWEQSLFATGNIAPWQEALVSTEVNGLSIVRLHTDIGETVHKGQLLAELQQDTLAAELEQTEAEFAQARAQLEEAQADAARAHKLKQTSALSAQQITQYLVAEKVARTRTHALQARVKAARLRLGQTKITAPDDGVVTERLATLGQVTSPGDILFRLTRQKRLEWRAELPAIELSQVKAGQPVTLKTSNASTVTGIVRQIAPTINPHTRNGLIYVDLDTLDTTRTGAFATGHIQLGEMQAPGIPLTAISFREGFAWVFLVDDKGLVQQRKVTTAQRRNGWVAITEGIGSQDRLVSSGVAFLSDGDRVRVVSSPVEDGSTDSDHSLTSRTDSASGGRP